MEDIEEPKKKKLNIFFHYEQKPSYFDEIYQVINNFNDKFIIKGEFEYSELLKEIYYYLGLKDENKGTIENKEVENVIILYIPMQKAIQLLKDFLSKLKKGKVKNDDHPFFIFLPYENNANFNIKNIFDEINDFHEDFNDSRKLDSRNLFIENKETILDRIEQIYNYFNENDEVNIVFNYNQSYDLNSTINIFVVGKRGSGKSTLINRLLGEKKAYAQKNAKTEKTKEYYHKYYPLKFIDSAGFEVGKRSELINVEDLLEKNNLNHQNISKKIHFIFYLFKKDDKYDDQEIELIKKLYSFNIEIFFIITFITEDDEESAKSDFEEALKKSFSKSNKGKAKTEEDKKKEQKMIEKMVKNIFCLDLLNIQYCIILCNIIKAINKKLKNYKESNDRIIEYLFNYNCLVKTTENTYEFIQETDPNYEEEKQRISKDYLKGGIVTPLGAKSPNDALSLIKSEIKNNIFFIDFNNDRENRKRLAINIVNSYKTPGFWLSSIPIPFLNEHLSRKSKEKMIGEIAKVYDFVVKKKMEELDFKENKSNFFVNFIFKIGGFVAGIWNKERVEKLGNKIIDELDAEYTKVNIFNVYYDKAKNLNKNFEKLSDFEKKFTNTEYWYNVNFDY